MIIETDDNILTKTPEYSVVIHPVNCDGELQQGLGQAINKEYPEWYEDYTGYCSWFKKSGWSDKCHFDKILGTFHRYQIGDKKIICSAFVQEGPFRKGFRPDLDMWDKVLRKIELQTRRVARIANQKWTLHMPYNICFDDNADEEDQLINIVKKYFDNSPVRIYLHKR